MVKKSSSWASWSSSGEHSEDVDLHRVRQDLEAKARAHLAGNSQQQHQFGSSEHVDVLPPNVEPGFETSYKRSSGNQRWENYY